MDQTDRLAWLQLKLLPGVGNRSILRLIEHFVTPERVIAASPRSLEAVPGLREPARTALCQKNFIRDPREEMKKIEAAGIRMLCLKDADYPANLSAIPDPPAVLFVSGGIEPRDLVSIAVVGSRNASPAGIVFTERLCGDLARVGVTVVSGLALGIDGSAHRGALKAGGRTIAVLGCGLDVLYPAPNAPLRGDIRQSGALCTEFPLSTPPAASHFPLRNRIISGLSLGVVVVEAAERSGSLITARYALEQGREVFAVPGAARSSRSIGPHRLLKQGAKLVETAEDILEEIGPALRGKTVMVGTPQHPPAREKLPEDAPRDEKTLLEYLDGDPRHIDDISQAASIPIHRVAAALLALELRGLVRQLPGKYFILV